MDISRYLSLTAKPARKPRAKPVKWELALQKQVIADLRKAFPYMKAFAINNNNVSARRGAEQRQAGVMAGVPDICIICESGLHGWIELKKPGANITESSFSPAQREFRDWCAEYGIAWAAANSADGAMDAVMRMRGMK